MYIRRLTLSALSMFACYMMGTPVFSQVLVLQVDRQTGATTLRNDSASPVSIQGYSVESAVGSLDSTNSGWNSLEDQAVANWLEVPSTSNELGELENSVGGSLAIAASGQQALGSAFAPLQPLFGSPEDLVFTYLDDTAGVLGGTVEYVGNAVGNTLLLTIDPSTGNAQIENISPSTTVQLQGYTITSANGSLLSSFESSLPDTEWVETAGSPNGVGELNFIADGSTTLAPSDTFDLTGVFSIGEVQDLAFEFFIETLLEGNFNGDGQVDAADLVVWEDSFGIGLNGSHFLDWQRNFGSIASNQQIFTGVVGYNGSFAPLLGAAAVPEPTSLMLIAIGALSLFVRRIPLSVATSAISGHK